MTELLVSSTEERKTGWIKILIICVLLIFSVILVFYIYYLFAPNSNYKPVNYHKNPLVYYLGSPLKETQYLYQDKELYLALDTLKGLAETDIYWDEIGNLMVITIDRDIINLIPENRVANKNGQSFTLAHPLIIKNGKSYLPAGLIQNLYNIKFIENKEANIFCLHNPMKPLLKGKVTVSAKLRNGPSKKEPWLLELRENELITIYNEEKGWFWVETEKGMLGYINKKDVQIYGITRVPSSNG